MAADREWLGAQVDVIASLRDEIARLRSDLTAVRAEQEVIQGKLDTCQAESATMRDQLRQALGEVREMSLEGARMRAELDLLNGD